jgi:hypothetical protein
MAKVGPVDEFSVHVVLKLLSLYISDRIGCKHTPFAFHESQQYVDSNRCSYNNFLSIIHTQKAWVDPPDVFSNDI